MADTFVFEPSKRHPGLMEYRHSGRVRWLYFLPVFAFSAVLAALWGIASLVIKDYWHWSMITQLLLSLPTMGLAVAVIRFGHVRSAVMAAVAGVCLAFVAHGTTWVGEWAVYSLSVAADEDETGIVQPTLKEKVGIGGPVGYYLLRCREDRIGKITSNQGESDTFGGHMFHGMDWIMALAMPGVAAAMLANMVYIEPLGRWAARKQYALPAGTEGAAIEAIRAGNLAALAELGAKGPGELAAVLIGTPMAELYYIPGTPEAGIFVSLSIPGSDPDAKIRMQGQNARWYLVSRIYMPPEKAAGAASAFPDMLKA